MTRIRGYRKTLPDATGPPWNGASGRKKVRTLWSTRSFAGPNFSTLRDLNFVELGSQVGRVIRTVAVRLSNISILARVARILSPSGDLFRVAMPTIVAIACRASISL